MSKKILFLFIMAAGIYFFPTAVLALGQMSEPIVIDNAMRGEIVQSEIIALNSDERPVVADFVAEGPIKDWTKFYLPGDLNNPISRGTIPAGETFPVVVFFNIPKDVANGEHKGVLSVISVPDKAEQIEDSSASVAQKIDRSVSITISDKEVIDLNGTSIIPESYDLIMNDPLKIRIIYDNQGNINLSPQIRIKISKDGQNVYDMIYPYPESESPINPESQKEIPPISIASAGWTEGIYQAQLIFSRGEEKIMEKSFKFSIKEKSSVAILGIGNNTKMTIFWSIILLSLSVLTVFAIKAIRSKKVAL